MIPYQRPQSGIALFERIANPPQISFSIRFDKIKIARIMPALSRFARVFKDITKHDPKLPRRIYALSGSEVRRGKKVRRDAGHGQYDSYSDTIKVNPHMNADNILLNVIHEIIHADLPWLAERQVDELSKKILHTLRPSVNSGRTPNPLGIDATQLTRGLWIGSKPEIGRAVGESGFDLLVLCAEEYQPSDWDFPGVDVIHAPFDDNDIGPLPQEKEIACKAAQKVSAALIKGQNVFVSCVAGRNRSGYVCGMALVNNGLKPLQAIQLIRGRRRNALTNQHFVSLILGN